MTAAPFDVIVIGAGPAAVKQRSRRPGSVSATIATARPINGRAAMTFLVAAKTAIEDPMRSLIRF